ncbi:hypothetical protein [Gaiella sp.]|uniref:hypothetical protein n=1 Tax=Gaiella sp. TaxID=2663207 RepID=UPI002E327AE1|nr:hypothetical protein [Gaiella sp.]HEX5584073.1 hypothetical protein [Gaiella sp.]
MAASVAVLALVATGSGLGATVKAKNGYRPRAVLVAFRAQGIKLVDANAGSLSPVTTLSSPRPRDGWRVGVFLYPNVVSAKRSFDDNVKVWRSSGMAAARQKNVVVTVVPNGRVIGRKAKPWPMPKPVARAIASFSSKK